MLIIIHNDIYIISHSKKNADERKKVRLGVAHDSPFFSSVKK